MDRVEQQKDGNVFPKDQANYTYERCPYTLKKFQTDSNIPYYMVFKTGNIGQPLFCLSDYEMETFFMNADYQTREADWREEYEKRNDINILKTLVDYDTIRESCVLLVKNQHKILAIKLLRRTYKDIGLKEAKDQVEKWEKEYE